MNCKGQGLRFFPVYGPQEKELEENRTDFYETLSIEIEKCFLSGDSLVLAGAFNAKLGNDIIKDDIHVMSPNGKLLHALMMKYNLSLLNSSEVCNGLFTRTRDCQSRKELSVLDYVFVSTDLYQQVKSMLIDEQLLFTPWRKLKKGKRFSDHRAIKIQVDLDFNKIINASKRTTVWNFNNPQSWNKFYELTKSEQLFSGYGLPVLTQKHAIGGGSVS